MLEANDNFTRNDRSDEHQINPLQSEASAELSSRPRAVDARAGGKMDGIFTVDSGVTQAQLQHNEAIVNALPTAIQQALLDGNVNIELTAGWHKGLPQGENSSSQGLVYTDSGMTDQALVHELYEMAGQISPTTVKGSWNDADAVAIADDATTSILNGQGVNPGDLNDTLSRVNFANGFQDDNTVHGDGDLMSNVFVADFYATHQSLYKDTVGRNVLKVSVEDAPELADYISKAQGLNSAVGSSDTFGSRAQPADSDPPILLLRR